MTHLNAAAAVLAATAMLPSSTFALTPGRITPAQIQAFESMTSKFSLADAVASATSHRRGKLLEITFTDFGHDPAYDAVLLSGDKLTAVTVDPNTGIVSPPQNISPGSGSALHEEQRVAETLTGPATTL